MKKKAKKSQGKTRKTSSYRNIRSYNEYPLASILGLPLPKGTPFKNVKEKKSKSNIKD
jgi:hypothetical protein